MQKVDSGGVTGFGAIALVFCSGFGLVVHGHAWYLSLAGQMYGGWCGGVQLMAWVCEQTLNHPTLSHPLLTSFQIALMLAFRYPHQTSLQFLDSNSNNYGAWPGIPRSLELRHWR